MKKNTILLFVVPVALCLLSVQCKSADEYLQIAREQLDQKNYTAAIENLTRSIRLDPSNPESWNSRAYAFFFLEDFQNSIADYTETLRLRPEMGDAYMFRSQAYMIIGEYEKAADDIEAVDRLIAAQKGNTVNSLR